MRQLNVVITVFKYTLLNFCCQVENLEFYNYI
jgi:hypothetical protein